MPKAGFTPEYKQDTGFDFPQLKLEKGEKARIVVIDPEPMIEFVHTLRSPVMQDDGTPVMERRDFGNGRSRMEVKRDFVGAHVCFGRFEVLREKGSDPEQCPTCKAAATGDGIDPPAARYAVHVLKYATKPGSFELQVPFSVTVLAWLLPATRFGKLVDFAAEHGDLRTKDLMLGPCESKNYQKYEIAVAANAAWLTGGVKGANAATAMEAYKNNRSPDLSPLIGRVVSKAQAADDVMEVQTATAMISGAAPAPVDPAANAAAAASALADVGGILDDPAPGTEVGAGDLDALLLAATETDAAPPAAASAPASTPAPTPAAPTAPVTPAQAPEVAAPAPAQSVETAPVAAAPAPPAVVEETVVTPAATAAAAAPAIVDPAPATGEVEDLDKLMADLEIG